MEAQGIRLLTPEELPDVYEVCLPIIAGSTHPGKTIEPRFFLQCWTALMQAGHVFIAGRFKDGQLQALCSMMVGPDLLTGLTHGQQLLVGVREGSPAIGLRSVMDFAEAEALRRGAKYLVVTRAETDLGARMDRFYVSRGYRAVQVNLQKDLCPLP